MTVKNDAIAPPLNAIINFHVSPHDTPHACKITAVFIN